ncbi:MAG: DUF2339 domain-containing protein [Pseudomonadota bacterium]
MILWGLIVGAVIGLIVGEFDQFAMALGAALGAAIGWGLRKAVRAEIAAMLAERTIETVSAAATPLPQSVTPRGVRVVDDRPESAAPAAPSLAPPQPVVPPARREPVVPPPPPVPAEPGVVERGVAAARDWLFGGNTIVRAGLVVLFLGLAFLVRWAAGAGLFPIELRLALVAAAGIALLVIGFNRRTERPGFALALQGGGVATLYLTIFAAGALYPMLPLPAAFLLMVLVCAAAVALALLQDAEGLAAAAFVGGYAVPLLLGGEGGPVAVMFGYHTLLNLGVLALAWKKAWRSINLIGFFATFGVATFWGVLSYRPQDFAVAQPFLILSILIYLAAAILYARNSDSRVGRFVDSSLLFGTALAGFGLQVGLVAPYVYGAAFSALGFGALYLALAVGVRRRGSEEYHLLAETLLAIGIGFATLAIPLAFGARWTGSAWALEGAGAFWVGMRQGRWMPRAFGLLLQFVAAFLFLGMLEGGPQALPIVNPVFLTGLLVALPILATAWWLREPLPHSGSRPAKAYAVAEQLLATPAFLFGFLLWSLAVIAEICRTVPPLVATDSSVPVFSAATQQLLTMVVLVVSAWGAAFVGRRLRWDVATWPGRVTLIVLAGSWFAQATLDGHVLYHPGWIAWIVVIALHLHLLRANDRDDDTRPGALLVQRLSHIGGVWLAAALLADSLWLGVDRGALWNSSWAGVVFLIASVLMLGALTFWAGRAAQTPAAERRWPLDRHLAGYHGHAPLPIAALVYGGSLVAALVAEGDAAPLPYVPLLNPVELTIALALAVLVLWRRSLIAVAPPYRGTGWVGGRGAWIALAGLGFIDVNMMWLRFAHHYLGVAWDSDALLDSAVVQAGLTILWTVLSLGLMLFAHRRAQRGVWVAGASLLVFVVLKLFFVDLSQASGGARIVTFIVVGALMLVVGYFAPLPPRGDDAKGETKEVLP